MPSLGDVVQPSKQKTDPQAVPDLPYLSLEHIEANSRQIVGQAEAREAMSTKAVFRAGDVLYGKLRPYLNKVCQPDFEGVCSTDILVFSQRPQLDSRYLLYFLNRPETVEAATHAMAGVNLPRVSFKTLGELEFPLPPLAEQRRIADRINDLLRNVDAARGRLANLVEDRKEGDRELPSILKRFRQAVLAAACSGQLTADWRERHPGEVSGTALLSRLAVERKSQWLRPNPNRKYRPAEPIADEELPEIPSTWAWTNFDHCAWEITVGHVGPMRARYVERGIPFLRSQNVRPLRFDSNGLVFIESDFHGLLRKSALTGGEILVTRSGANTGDCCVYPEDAGAANCADLVVTRPLSGLVAAYGAIYISSPEGQARIGLRETGMAQPHFNIGAMRVKPFPLPPPAEQHEIVRQVEAVFASADRIEARVRAATVRGHRLTEAILAAAFRGELVPNEAELARIGSREYETAEQLLARIRQDLVQRKPETRRRTTTKPKKVAMKRNPIEVLKEAKKGLSPEQLFRDSGCQQEDVDAFYEHLRHGIESGEIVQTPENPDPNNPKVVLSSAKG